MPCRRSGPHAWPPLLLALGLLAAASSPAPAAAAAQLLVAGAADLVFAFREIAPAFEREHGVRVTLTLGSSGQLAQQIEYGAPFDVFFAANREFVERLRARGRVVPESLRPYARGLIVLATRADRPALPALRDLLREQVKRVALASPAHAPYGLAAKEALQGAGLWERLQSKLVYAENISQAQQFVRTGDVDAGVLALSVVQTPEIRHVPIDPGLYRPLIQWAAVTAASRQADLAAAFIRFVAEGAGRPVLERFGFQAPARG